MVVHLLALRLRFLPSAVCSLAARTNKCGFIFKRSIGSTLSKPIKMGRAAVIGVFSNDADYSFTETARQIDTQCEGKISELLTTVAPLSENVTCRLFYAVNQYYHCISVVDLGPEKAHFDSLEEIEQKWENIRCAIGIGVKALKEAGYYDIDVDGCGHPESAAEGSFLVCYCYDELKHQSLRRPKVSLHLHSSNSISGPYHPMRDPNWLQYVTPRRNSEWQSGAIKAVSQNYARYLMEAPANHMTPYLFAMNVQAKLSELNIKVIIREKAWIEEMKMGSFLSVTRGSSEPPLFLELYYEGVESHKKPVVLVGKGITFDSGGISLKPSASMDKMRADMGGAACVAASIYGVAFFKANLNVRGLIPLCENMPGGSATKPGDVVYAMNGKSIQVDNTDAEGRLILADALLYAKSFNPEVIVDIATLTGAMDVALGAACTGAFTNAATVYNILQTAGMHTGDRVWKMPLFTHYKKQVCDSRLADMNNIGKCGRSGGACTAAAFLKEFVDDYDWIHLDIAGVMETEDQVPYLPKGMSGRPTRTLIEFLLIFAASSCMKREN